MKANGQGTAIALAPGEKNKTKADTDQMIVILDGSAKIRSGSEKNELSKNESLFVKKNSEYEIMNSSKWILVYVIVQAAKNDTVGG